MTLQIRHNGGLGEPFTSTSDFLNQLSGYLTTSGWTVSLVTGGIQATATPPHHNPIYVRYTVSETTLSIQGSLDSQFTTALSSTVHQRSLTSNAYHLVVDESTIILSTRSGAAVYCGAIQRESPIDRNAWVVLALSTNAGRLSQVARSSLNNNAWTAIFGALNSRTGTASDLDTLMSGGQAKSSLGGYLAKVYPIADEISTVRGKLKYVIAGVSDAGIYSRLNLSTSEVAFSLGIPENTLANYPEWASFASDYIILGQTNDAVGVKFS